MKKLLKVLGIVFLVLVIVLVGGFIYFNSTYPKVEAAPNLKVELTPERIERGKYLANNVSSCIDCHSTRDWTKFAGPATVGTEGKGGERFGKEIGFPGTVYSKNITPANLGSWTDGEIFRAITSGVDKNGKVMFPIMPYMSYNKMAKEDIYSIIAYLRTLQPIENDIPQSEIDFPLNFIMKTFPQNYSEKSVPDKNNPVEYGKYLVTIGACQDCHTPQESKTQLSGGAEFHVPIGTLRSANITPDNETGIGAWTKETFIARFKAFESDSVRNVKLNPTDFNTIMPWPFYAGMTEEDLGAIYDYLKSIKPVKNRVERFTPASQKKIASN